MLKAISKTLCLACLYAFYVDTASAIPELETLSNRPVTVYDLMFYKITKDLEKKVSYGEPNIARCSVSESFSLGRIEIKCGTFANKEFTKDQATDISRDIANQVRYALGYENLSYDLHAMRVNPGYEEIVPISNYIKAETVGYAEGLAIGKAIEDHTILQVTVFTDDNGFVICESTLHRAGAKCEYTSVRSATKKLFVR